MRDSRFFVTLVAAAVALGAVIALATGAPATGDAIRAALPQPDKKLATPGTVQFVGQDATKTFNVAVVRSGSGAVLAYVCDGKSIGRWLTGTVEDGVAELTGRGGATLRAVFRKGKVTGSARIGTTRITFALTKAERFYGLRRTLARAGGKRFEAAWITTNSGITRGLASEEGGKTVATSSSSTNPVTDPNVGVTPSPGGNVEPTILRKFRCGRLVKEIARLQGDQLNGRGDPASTQEQLDDAIDKFVDLRCGDFFAFS